jgi:hypothetical protein
LTHVLFAWQAKVIGKFGRSEIVFAGRRQTLDALSSTWQAQESVHVADALATVDQNKGCFRCPFFWQAQVQFGKSRAWFVTCRRFQMVMLRSCGVAGARLRMLGFILSLQAQCLL